jgi:hypothetical protein
MEHLRNLVKYFKDKAPDRNIPRASEEMFAHLEETLLPRLLQVIKKDNTMFTGEDAVVLFPGVDTHDLWDGSDDTWSKLHMALLHSVLHGDPKEKFGKILDAIKSVIPGGSEQADEISRILEDESTQSSLKDILDLVMNTRLASFIGDVVQSIQYDDLDLDFENPEDILNMMRDPTSSPALNTLMERAKTIMEDRIRSGKINQQELVREIETIKARLQSEFGRYLNEMVVGSSGSTTGNTSHQILSNSPDARRARMLARLQKKHREKLGK